MNERIVILGGGTGGTLLANRLRAGLGDRTRITVIDRDDSHLYQPGLLFVPFGLTAPQRLVRSRSAQLREGIDLRLATVDSVELAAGEVTLQGGGRVGYDVLVIASGASLLPRETEGLTGPGWGTRAFTFYTLDGATGLRDALASWRGGKLVVNLTDLPIKCPVAPLEFCFLADWHLRRRGIRGTTELTFVTSLDGAFTKPVASRELDGLLRAKGVEVVTDFNTGSVDGEAGVLTSYDGREVPFDLLVSVPLHGGAEFVQRSPELADELGFVRVDRHTLRSLAAENVFAIGDATDAPTSKAGSVAHFQADTVAANVGHVLASQPLEGSFDGHANCFVETGYGKGLLIDFNYELEPVTGRFPDPRFGPLPLLRESRLNHLGKRAFEWAYWHLLLPGHRIPGVRSQLQNGGGRMPAITQGATR